jgi:ELWxxDGT repeat protein
MQLAAVADDGWDASHPQCASNRWSTMLSNGRLLFDWKFFGFVFKPVQGSVVYSSDGTHAGLRWLDRFGGLGSCTLPWVPLVVDRTAYLLTRCDGIPRLTATRGTKRSTFLMSIRDPEQLTRTGNRIVYVARDRTGVGRELWGTDGTRKVSHVLSDIKPGPASSDIQDLTSHGTYATFTADDGHGRADWVTDGTIKGTYKVQS